MNPIIAATERILASAAGICSESEEATNRRLQEALASEALRLSQEGVSATDIQAAIHSLRPFTNKGMDEFRVAFTAAYLLASIFEITKPSAEKCVKLHLSLAALFENSSVSIPLCLTLAIDNYRRARDHFFPRGPIKSGSICGPALRSEADLHFRLADLTTNSVCELEEALRLYEQTRRWVKKTGSRHDRRLLISMVNVYMSLVQHGQEKERHLKAAIQLCEDAARSCFRWGPSYATALISAAQARSALSEFRESSMDVMRELEIAVALCKRARKCFFSNRLEKSRGLMIEANAQKRMAQAFIKGTMEMGVQGTFSRHAELVLEGAVRLFTRARSYRRGYGPLLVNEANTREFLARFRENPVPELELAIKLYAEAQGCWEEGTADWSYCLRNHACALLLLARKLLGAHGRTATLLREAHGLMEKSLAVAETMRGLISNEAGRIDFAEHVSGGYSRAIQVCLDLADLEEGQNADQAEAWRWEAWRWTQRGKSRALLEQMAGLNATSVSKGEPFCQRIEKHAAEMDRIERELWRLRRWMENSPDANGGHSMNFESAVKGGDSESVFDLLVERGAPQPQQGGTWRELCAQLKEASTDYYAALESLDDRAYEIMLNAAHGASQDAHTDARTSLAPMIDALNRLAGGQKVAVAEFMVLDREEIGVFLFPIGQTEKSLRVLRLWLNAASVKDVLSDGRPPKAVDVALEPGALERLAAWILGAASVLSIGGRSRQAPSSRHGQIVQVGRDPAEERKKAIQHLDAALLDLGRLFEPILGCVGSATELILCPSGFLNLLPLHAATSTTGEALIERYPITIMPTAALAPELARRQTEHTADSASGWRGVVYGDPTPDFPLKHAREEAQLVGEALESIGFQHAKPRVGPDATRENFFAEASHAAVIHLAAHSVISDVFQRSGIELHDRRLSVFDVVFRIQMQHAMFVYLSSCDSGQVQADRTSELMGIVRSFFTSGCPTVMASLWALDDEVGKLFAENFYAACAEGRTFAEANRIAMLALRDRPRGAFYWAPFILIGAGSTRLTSAR